jgi:hypothetical protein
MIRLRDLLENLLSEGSEKTFKLNPTQYNELDAIITKFGGDLSGITESLTEAPKPDYTKMTAADMEEKGYVVAVDKSVLSNLETFLEAGMAAKGWYADMNSKILSALGDSDGCLFLILMAIFSPQNKLAQNFLLAARCYEGIKADVNDPNRIERFQAMIQLEPGELYKRIKANEFRDMETIERMVKNVRNLPSYLSNLVRVLRLYSSKGFTFSKSDVVKEIARHFTPSGALGNETVISAEKVFSFTLNLLDPSYEFEGGWLPVTMDTWMASFFYPQMGKKEKSKLLGKTANYVYMAKLTQDLASKFGMKPLEMQAVIWVAMIKKKQGANYDVTFDNAIQKNLAKLKIKIDEMKDVKTFFQTVISAVGKG